jgi:hypothetical protein
MLALPSRLEANITSSIKSGKGSDITHYPSMHDCVGIVS